MQRVTRLITQYLPSHYDLTLELDAAERLFGGVVAIDGRLPAATSEVRLHAVGLRVRAASLNGSAVRTAQDGDELVLISERELTAGPLRIEVSFDGQITDAMHGIYPSTFEQDGAVHTLLATQFESHHAREAFPCIDEPEAKATFDLTLVTAPGITTLSNMPVAHAEQTDGRATTRFETTPKMSTYLLAFVAGELHGVHGTTRNGTAVSVWAAPTQPADSLGFALETAIAVTEFFNDYFDTPYPLPKCDHVALPDFSSGAMENWGLITYREVCLVVDPVSTAIATKEFAATVIAHEISHQWFGNLVTMKWWDDLWLNESFATLMEYVAIDALHPEWDIWLTFTSHEALHALRRDALPGVQAVKTDVSHPDQINTLFDGAIVYAKGARLLHMLYRLLGDDAFRHGLKAYFKTHAYGNTEGADLWHALETASGQPVTRLMSAWLERPNYPIVYASQDGARLRVRQEPFLMSGPADGSDPWPVPLLSTDERLHSVILNETAGEYDLPSDDIVRLNASGSGHYTVRYQTEPQQTAIKQAIANRQVSPSERLLLLNDCTMQARADIGSAVEILQLLDAYRQETAEPVWDMIALAIADVRRLIEDDDTSETRLKRFVAQLIRPQLERLGWEPKPQEPQSDTKLRATIIGLGIYSEDRAIIDEALRRFAAAESLPALPAELRPLLFSAAIKHGAEGAFDTLLKLYAGTKNAELQQDVAAGLTSSRDEAEIRHLIGLLKSDTIRLQDVDRWFVYLLRNKHSREAAWQWMVEEWPWIEDKFGHDKSYENYPRYAANVLASQEWLERYRTFFEPLKEQPALQRVIDIGLADIASRAAWKERDAPLLAAYLAETVPATAAR